ncbi:MAG: M28 family peptidase [Candidatus Krumholzibacteriia bacterium]
MTIRILPFLLAAALLVVRSGPGARAASDPLETIRILTRPEMAGRGAGSAGGRAAADSVAVWMSSAGLQPAFAGGWFQEFPLQGEGWAGQRLEGGTGRNVAGILPGDGALAGRFIVIGAHFDHLGLVDPAGATGLPGPEDYYPGANDNAAGVAVLRTLMESARSHGDGGRGRRSVIFVAFDAEEVGLQGSAAMVRAMPVALDSIDAMINLDTIGQLTDRKIYVSGVGTAAGLEELARAANTGGLTLSLARGGWSGSDHMSFNTREVPVLFVFGGPYPQYNRPADTWDTVDPGSVAAVTAYTDRLLASLRAYPGPLVWVMVAERNLRDDGESGAGSNRATWLGTLPDFTEEVRGYLLAGVFDDSPAARCGLEKGDLLVRMGSHPVADLATFTTALRAHDPGDLVELEVVRRGQTLNFTVVLGDRADRE